MSDPFSSPRSSALASLSSTVRDYEFVDHFAEERRRLHNPTIGDLENIANEIQSFEKTLDPNQEVALSLASFAGRDLFHVQRVYRSGARMIVFEGRNSAGERVRLVQHHSQVSLLLVAAKKLDEVASRIQIGFDTSGSGKK